MESFKINGIEYTLAAYGKRSFADRAALREEVCELLRGLHNSKLWKAASSTIQWPGEAIRVMMDWESTVETPSERLGRLLATMDWFYSYSDDHRVWSKYNEQLERIRALTIRLGHDEAQPIWDTFAPGKFEGCTRYLKYEEA